MAIDLKILRIGLLSAVAIIAPLATILIQHELKEFEYEEELYEGEINLVTLDNQQQDVAVIPALERKEVAKKPEVKWKMINGRKSFKTKDDCLTVFKSCIKVNRKNRKK